MHAQRQEAVNVSGKGGGVKHMLKQLVTRHPLTVFFGLTYILSWCSAPLSGGQIIPHGPAVAAVSVLALTEGRSGLRKLWLQMVKWRVSWRWYLIAPGIVVAYSLSAFLLNLLLGASITHADRLLSISFLAALFLELLLAGGTWEEPGWSYGLAKLQARFADQPFGLLRASLVMAVLRMVWHIPLWFYGQVPVFEVLLTIGFQFIITWLYNRTHGSILIVMLFHLTSNVLTGRILTPLFIGNDKLQYYALVAGLAFVTGLLLIRAHQWSMGTTKETKRTTLR
jgi:hypothetical protein